MSPIAIVLIILGLAMVGLLLFLYLQARGRRRLIEDVPPSMRPAFSDEELETSVLERYMAWGLVLTLFFAVFLPVYWLREPRRLAAQQEEDFVEAYVRGEENYQQYCAQCHGSNALGGFAASPYDAEELWPAPALLNIVARYADSEIVTDVEDLLEATIHRGRPGTPMPTWGAAFGGPLTDQQIDDIIAWILANQIEEVQEPREAVGVSGQELYLQNCARCHGEDLRGLVGPNLVGVLQRHEPETLLGILQNGIYFGAGVLMPPWQNGYTYPDGRFEDDALLRIIEYLKSQQPEQLPAGTEQFQTPGKRLDDVDLGPAADDVPTV